MVAGVQREGSTAPGAASAARAGVRISFAGRSAVLRRRRFGPALLREAPRCSCLAVACGDRGVSNSTWAGGLLFGADGVAATVSRDRVRPGMHPRPPRLPQTPRQFRLRCGTPSLSVPSCLADVPEVSRGRRLPCLDVHPARNRAPGASGSIRPRRPSNERRGASVPRGCIPRRKSAILAYRVIAHWHLGVGIHELWRRACTGFPPAVWSPSLSGWLPTTPPQGGSHMAATIAPAPKRHQRNLLITLAATALKADLAHRHYRIAPPGDRPRKAPSAASGRRPVVTVRCASDREHRLVGPGPLAVEPARVRRARDAPGALDGHQPRPTFGRHRRVASTPKRRARYSRDRHSLVADI